MHIDYVGSIKKNYLGRIGVIILLFMVFIAFVAPLLPIQSPIQPSVETLQGPSAKHWLGTNEIGQDIFSRIIFGARTSLSIALLVGTFTTIISAVLGGTSALFGGLYERVVMRIADIFLTLPNIIVIILIAAYIRPGIWLFAIIISVLSWQGGARVIRAQTHSLKNRAHIHAARTFGASNFYILFKHIIPDLAPILIVEFIQSARRAVFMEAGLAFLGILDPTIISWGVMLNRALEFSYLGVWNWLLPPGIALAMTIVAFTFVGYVMEEILNPNLQERKICCK